MNNIKVGDIIECIKTLPKALYNERYNVGDKAIVVAKSDVFDTLFRLRKLDGEEISLHHLPESIYFKKYNNGRKFRIENLEL